MPESKERNDRPDETELQALRELARGVIKAQGNVYIKELLRSKGIQLGATKEDFERNLLAAIDAGQLRLTDIETWLDEVEGWGNQHVYLFSVPDSIAADEVIRSVSALRRRVEDTEFSGVWEAATSQAFPEVMQLTSIRFDGNSLRLTWHEGDTTWARGKEEKNLDRPLDIGIDHYELRAYRQMSRRAVMRFELHLSNRLVAIFLSIAFDEKKHEAAVSAVFATLAKLVDNAAALPPILVGDVIRRLDHAVARKDAAKVVRSHSTRMTGKSAYVEMGSSTDEGSYLDDPTIGAVRAAIRDPELGTLSGTTANFDVLQVGLAKLTKDVRLTLYGPQKRVRIWKMLKAEEVWAILELLAKYR